MKNGKINVVTVGLGFGAEFIPIYQRHPQANMYGICQRTRAKLDQVGDAFGIGSANWTCVGLCAHQSALKGGEIVRLLKFTLSS
jgi:hypothetical protein